MKKRENGISSPLFIILADFAKCALPQVVDSMRRHLHLFRDFPIGKVAPKV